MENENKLPNYFKPILWSYIFEECDPNSMKKTIILQALNYGNLKHWSWIRSFYGEDEIKKVLESVPDTSINNKTKNLIETIFGFNNWNYARRSIIQ